MCRSFLVSSRFLVDFKVPWPIKGCSKGLADSRVVPSEVSGGLMIGVQMRFWGFIRIPGSSEGFPRVLSRIWRVQLQSVSKGFKKGFKAYQGVSGDFHGMLLGFHRGVRRCKRRLQGN